MPRWQLRYVCKKFANQTYANICCLHSLSRDDKQNLNNLGVHINLIQFYLRVQSEDSEMVWRDFILHVAIILLLYSWQHGSGKNNSRRRNISIKIFTMQTLYPTTTRIKTLPTLKKVKICLS